jgi:hypothetical protein
MAICCWQRRRTVHRAAGWASAVKLYTAVPNQVLERCLDAGQILEVKSEKNQDGKNCMWSKVLWGGSCFLIFAWLKPQMETYHNDWLPSGTVVFILPVHFPYYTNRGAGGVAQVVERLPSKHEAEFKPQYSQKKREGGFLGFWGAHSRGLGP